MKHCQTGILYEEFKLYPPHDNETFVRVSETVTKSFHYSLQLRIAVGCPGKQSPTSTIIIFLREWEGRRGEH